MTTTIIVAIVAVVVALLIAVPVTCKVAVNNKIQKDAEIVGTASKKSGMRTNRKNRIKVARRSNCADKSSQRVKIVRLCPLAIL